MFGRKSTTEALVVGAGPVGLFTALQLARHGVEVEIIDSQWRTAARSYALALHPSTVALFEDIGLAKELLEEGRRVRSVGFCDRQGLKESVDLGLLSGTQPFVLVVPQSRLEAWLETLLARRGVEVQWNHRLAGLVLDDTSVRAVVQRLAKQSTGYSVASTEWVVEKTAITEAKFVFGADGHSSAVRRLAGIAFEDVGGSQQFAVFECSSDGDAGSQMKVVLDDDSSCVYWPLPGKRFRWSFGLADEEVPGDRSKHRLAVQVGEGTLPFLSPGSLVKLLAERAPWFKSQVSDVHWSVGVRFERRLATEFGRGPVSLLGDAAHMAGPIGVQSMNRGLAEAAELTGRVSEMIRDGGSRVGVDSYDRQRAAEWRVLLGLEGAPVAGRSASPWVREHAGRIPYCIPASGGGLAEAMAQLDLKFGD